MISTYKYDLILIQTYIVLIWTSLRNAALRHEVPKGGSINLILFVTRFDNAHPTSRRHECSLSSIRDCTVLLAICYTLLVSTFRWRHLWRVSSSRGQFAGRFRLHAHSRRIVRVNARGEVNPCPMQGKREDGEIASNTTS